MTKKLSHGGSRPGAGRPATVQGKRRDIYIPDDFWNILLELGGGNASAGLRVALADRWSAFALKRLGFSDDEIRAIVENDDDTYELQCPKCQKFWAYFNKDFTRGICPNCGEIEPE